MTKTDALEFARGYEEWFKKSQSFTTLKSMVDQIKGSFSGQFDITANEYYLDEWNKLQKLANEVEIAKNAYMGYAGPITEFFNDNPNITELYVYEFGNVLPHYVIHKGDGNELKVSKRS